MKRFAPFLPLALLLCISAYFAFGLTRDPRIIQSVLIDKVLPGFKLPLFGQAGASLESTQFRGQVRLLNVFASWCVACRAEHAVLLKLTRGKKIAIYGLAWKDKPEELKQWLEELGNPYLGIGDDASGRTAIDLGVTGAPETFVIDRLGRIRYKQIGPIDDYIWHETIEPLIAKIESEK